MHDLFLPQGSHPLSAVKLGNPRCAKVEFDRAVRGNVLVLDGDIAHSKMQIPREDRPVSSLQLYQPFLICQLMIPSSGQFLLEVTASSSPMVRMKLSAGTFISKADVSESKGIANAKIPLAIPRNSWVQVVFHLNGLLNGIFNLPAVKWIDSVVLAGSCKVRRLSCCADETMAIGSKPPGMVMYAVPAYGPPVWGGAEEAKQQEQPVASGRRSNSVNIGSRRTGNANGASANNNGAVSSDPTSPTGPRSPTSAPAANNQRSGRGSGPGAETPPPGGSARGPGYLPFVTKRQPSGASDTQKGNAAASPGGGGLFPLSSEPPEDVLTTRKPSNSSAAGKKDGGDPDTPIKMKFVRDANGNVTFVATNADQEKKRKEEEERHAAAEAEAAKMARRKSMEEEIRRQREEQRIALAAEMNYVRLVEPEQAPPTRAGTGGPRTSLLVGNPSYPANRLYGNEPTGMASRKSTAAAAAPSPSARRTPPTEGSQGSPVPLSPSGATHAVNSVGGFPTSPSTPSPSDGPLRASTVLDAFTVNEFTPAGWDEEAANSSAGDPLVLPGFIVPAKVVAATAPLPTTPQKKGGLASLQAASTAYVSGGGSNSSNPTASGAVKGPAGAAANNNAASDVRKRQQAYGSTNRKRVTGMVRKGSAKGTPSKPRLRPSQIPLTGHTFQSRDPISETYDADDFDAWAVPRERNVVGYGVGCMDVIHEPGSSEEEDETDEEEEEEEEEE